MSEAIKEQLPAVPQSMEIDASWVSKRDDLLNQSKKIEQVQDNDTYQQAEEKLKQITSVSNDAEKLRKELGKPFLEAQRKIKSVADDARDPLEEEKKRLKKVMQTYIDEVERKRQEEIERQAEEQRKKQEEAEASGNPFEEMQAEAEAEQAVEPSTPNVQKTMSRTRKEPEFEIVNPQKVPRDYCTPDEKKIRHAVKKEGVREIPGVKIWEQTKVSSK